MKLEEIKEGQYLYYTERSYGSDYADGLVKIINTDDVLMANFLCTNWHGKYINRETEWSEDLPIASYFDEKCWSLADYDESDPSKWMTLNYPVKD